MFYIVSIGFGGNTVYARQNMRPIQNVELSRLLLKILLKNDSNNQATKAKRVEKPCDFDPFGQTGFAPFGYNIIDPFGQNSIDLLAHLLL